jgi:cytochrome c-type biogenesis protein CcmE
MRFPKPKLFVALGILGVGFSYLVFGAVKEASTYSVPIREVPAFSAQRDEVRVIGKVKPGSITKHPSGLGVSFLLMDETGVIPVSYGGAVPDMLRENGQVIVQGTLQGDKFQAKTLLTSCPSRYSAEPKPTQARNTRR